MLDLQKWQDEIQNLRAQNGWRIEIHFCGAFIIRVFDKETDKLLASTGATGLGCIPEILKMPFDKCPWTNNTFKYYMTSVTKRPRSFKKKTAKIICRFVGIINNKFIDSEIYVEEKKKWVSDNVDIYYGFNKSYEVEGYDGFRFVDIPLKENSKILKKILNEQKSV